MVHGEERQRGRAAPSREDGRPREERPAREVERARRLDRGEAARRRLAALGGEAGEVDAARRRAARPARGGAITCTGAAGDLGEGRAQRLVAADDRGERAARAPRVEGTAQAERHRHVVERPPGLQAVEEPEPLLGEGERQAAAPRGARGTARRGRRRLQPAPATAVRDPSTARDGAREVGEARQLEQAAQRELDAEGLAEARDELGGEERVAAELEEAVAGARPPAPRGAPPRSAASSSSKRPAGAADGRRRRPRRPAVGRSPAGRAARARRSTLPLGVSGRASRATKAAGTMWLGEARGGGPRGAPPAARPGRRPGRAPRAV